MMNIINIFNKDGKTLEEIMREFFLMYYLNTSFYKDENHD